MAKVISTFDLGKLSRKLSELVDDGLDSMATRVNHSIQKGIDTGVDIENKPFEPLGPARSSVRGPGAKILDDEGRMRKTTLIKASASGGKHTAIIRMSGRRAKGKYVGTLHNEGYTVTAGRFKGSTVPKRNWFGIPKDMRAGGKEYKKAIGLIKKDIRRAWKKHKF